MLHTGFPRVTAVRNVRLDTGGEELLAHDIMIDENGVITSVDAARSAAPRSTGRAAATCCSAWRGSTSP